MMRSKGELLMYTSLKEVELLTPRLHRAFRFGGCKTKFHTQSSKFYDVWKRIEMMPALEEATRR